MTARASSLRWAEWPIALLGVAFACLLVRAPLGGATTASLAAATIAGLMLWIVWQDLATFTIPDAALVAIAALGVALRLSAAAIAFEPPIHAVIAALLDVALCGGTLLLLRESFFRLKGFDGLGLGDVKLAAVGALLVGGVGFSWALLAASAAGLATVAAARLAGRPPVERLAFGAVLAPAIWGVWLVEQALPRFGAS